MLVSYSDLDSDRFGYRIGRAILDPAVDGWPGQKALGAEIEGYEVVILRAPVDAPLLAARLTAMPGWHVFTADHLFYWEWRGDDLTPRPLPDGFHLEDIDDPARVESMLRASFTGYQNHYTANPLFDPADALDGYMEWAGTLIRSADTTAKVACDSSGEPIAFGVIDWTTSPADVRLAGVSPETQGGGWYGKVVHALLIEAAGRGSLPVYLSTQSSNINVMRAWVRLGCVPAKCLATYHLVSDTVWPAGTDLLIAGSA